jgi:type IV secretion system protein VirB4
MFETDSGTAYAFSYHVGQVSTSTLVGLSGTGKTSVLSATLALSTKYKGWRFIFDRDHGMSVMVRALGGSYSELKMGIKTGMAPFQIQKSKSSIAFNTLLLKRILSKDKALSASDEKLIETVVERAFALPKEKRIFRNLAPFFGTPHEGSLREKFDRWHSNGANAWVFDSEVDNFQIDSNIYGLYITEMINEAYSEVKTPIFMYLFERIGELLDGSPTMILIPEGWQVLQDEMFSAQIDAWSRTNRKNNVTLVMDTQSISEFDQATNKDSQSDLKGGNSLIREAVTTLFFANPKANRSEYDSFNISDKEFDIIKYELETKKAEHFFLLKQGDQSVIARMPLHGLDDELDLISPNKHKIALGNELAKTIKDNKAWLEAYKTEVQSLKHNFNDNFKKWFSERTKEAA